MTIKESFSLGWSIKALELYDYKNLLYFLLRGPNDIVMSDVKWSHTGIDLGAAGKNAWTRYCEVSVYHFVALVSLNWREKKISKREFGTQILLRFLFTLF